MDDGRLQPINDDIIRCAMNVARRGTEFSLTIASRLTNSIQLRESGTGNVTVQRGRANNLPLENRQLAALWSYRIHLNGLTMPEPVAQLKAMGKPTKTDADAKFDSRQLPSWVYSHRPNAPNTAWLITDEYSGPPHAGIACSDDLTETFAAISFGICLTTAQMTPLPKDHP